MNPVTPQDAQAMDDMAAWGAANPARTRAPDAVLDAVWADYQVKLSAYRRPDFMPECDQTPDCTPVCDEDNEDLTPEQAIDLATEEWLGTPYNVARWLLSHCRTPESKYQASGIDELHDDQVMELPIPALLSVAMTGTNEQAMIALRVLREVAKELNYDWIAKRANQLVVPL
jgi:hypothetical protein